MRLSSVLLQNAPSILLDNQYLVDNQYLDFFSRYIITSLYLLDAYTSGQLVYEWQEGLSVNFVPGMALSQFDLMGSPYRNLTFVRREGEFSVLQVSFNLQRHTGYFLIQVSARKSWRSLQTNKSFFFTQWLIKRLSYIDRFMCHAF